MDWFEKLTGFREAGYEDTKRRLAVAGARLRSLVNGHEYGIGELELAPLHLLRQRAHDNGGARGRVHVRTLQGDVRALHQRSEFASALFQVASQFNMLEMTHHSVTPEHGVSRYADDPTQGPACALAAGAATIYRNYFVPVDGQTGQTMTRQLDGLADLGTALGETLRLPVSALWRMQNGYALCSASGLAAISSHLSGAGADAVDSLRGLLRIGCHRDVEVTDANPGHRHTVSQAFCSALPVAYSDVPRQRWAAFATLVLEAAYEATIWAAVVNAQRGVSNTVLLTRLGGGAFGNDEDWIHAAMRRALRLAQGFELDVVLVSQGRPPEEFRTTEREFAAS